MHVHPLAMCVEGWFPFSMKLFPEDVDNKADGPLVKSASCLFLQGQLQRHFIPEPLRGGLDLPVTPVTTSDPTSLSHGRLPMSPAWRDLAR